MGWFKTLIADAKRFITGGDAPAQAPAAPTAAPAPNSTPVAPSPPAVAIGAASPAVQMCPIPPHIVTVGFTTKRGEKPMFGGTRKQYVNLSDAVISQHDTDIPSANQLARTPPIYVKVAPPGVHSVRVRLVRAENGHGFAAGSASLSARESGLAHLQWDEVAEVRSTNAQGELLMEPGLDIAALGGYDYQAEASLDGAAWVRGGNSAKVRRRVYIRPVVRYAAGRTAAFAAISAVQGELGKYDIDVQQTLSEVGDEFHVIEQSTLPKSLIDIGNESMAGTASINAFKPHVVAVIVGEFMADPAAVSFEVELVKALGKPLPDSVTLPLKRDTRWYVNVPLHDKSNVVKAQVSGGLFDTVDLEPSELEGTESFAMEVKIDLRRAKTELADHDTLTVTLKLKALSGWAVGWAYNSHPVIYLNMRDPNTGGVLSADKATALVIHELGHKLHLAAPGNDGQPDKQPHHYPSFDSHGVKHQGPHCSTGVASGTDLWDKAAQNAASCTMWGNLKGIKVFCSECQTALRKVDLSSGF
jgi:hypothetical protein